MNQLSSKYFHDRVVLLLLSVNAFLTMLTAISVLFRLQGGGDGFIVQYRANLGISAFKTGNVDQVIMFVVFAVVVFAIHGLLAWRTYDIRRQLSVVVLLLGALLLLLGVIVSDALVALR
jgi:hypothetical protein